MKELAYKIQCDAKWNQLQDTEKKPQMKDVIMCLIKKQSEGILTRDVADECDMSIYAARNWLLKLENNGLLKREAGTKSCKWFIL
ncbi:FaeA/PapI family transcriptional regulator [Pantoea stewartii]|uniref:FaeA/PapI family transcriptional regulator n=1 Tax=Pantoea stewartii TaxID=66269 RepID=UPI0021E7A25B|nr:FaeA/PapI family transcriptional regulator [Pantoea stewartii]UYK97525.1 FaeA/PapI family transcriptional regulator [Pantoea stewartii]